MEKMLSIITNFGCHYTCPYCVVKETGIYIPKTTLESLDLLLDIYQNGNYNGISVSGGGDPMHEYEKHTDYYDKLFSICSENHIPLELHTSYIRDGLPYSHFDLIAFHLINTEDILKVNTLDCGSATKRIVFVVDKNFTEQKIDDIYDIYLCCYDILQLSFRQMILPDYSAAYYCHNHLKEGHKHEKWHYIEQCDYNTYFVNGKITDGYEDFRIVKDNSDESDVRAVLPVIDIESNDFGCILTAAVRYSLGRRTYMPSLVTSFIRPFLPYLSDNTVWNLQKDVSECRNYGDDCDIQTWTAFLEDVRAEIRKRGIKR